jgi:2-methylcitrate dehydratase PrpD
LDEIDETSRAQVIDFIGGGRWSDLPAAAMTRLKGCVLDCLGAAVTGAATPVAQIADKYAAEAWTGTGATVLRSGRDTAAIAAAFVNAVATNGTDIDDCGIYTGGHPGAQVVPVALAVAESRGVTGEDLLYAVLVGYEIAFRAGRCMNDRYRSAEQRGFRACGSWGSVASAAIASRLMGLSPSQTSHALGIAEYHSPELPLMRDLDHPSMVKHGMGVGAMTGIMSAELATLGFTGVPSILFFDQYGVWVQDIGVRYLIVDGIMWKRFSCCAYAHPALYATLAAIKGLAVEPQAVRRVTVSAYHEACRLGGRLPETTEEAQFNLAWPIACLLAHGEVAPRHVLGPALADPVLRRLAQKVDFQESSEFTRLYDLSEAGEPEGRELARVMVELEDGTLLDSGPVEAEVYSNWPWPEVAAKFRRITAGLVDESRCERLVEAVWHLEELRDLQSLTSLLTGT